MNNIFMFEKISMNNANQYFFFFKQNKQNNKH